MIKVILESPYGGNVPRNEEYARLAMRECLLRGESPYASHLLYTQPGVLDDTKQEERALGISAGFEWREGAIKTVVYIDYGISRGMHAGILHAQSIHQVIEWRRLDYPVLFECEITCNGPRAAYQFSLPGLVPFFHYVNL